jgi:hypothetical protein
LDSPATARADYSIRIEAVVSVRVRWSNVMKLLRLYLWATSAFGFRGPAIGGFRGGAITRAGFRGVGIAGRGFHGPAVGRGVRVAGFRGGGWGWRRGWGLPLAAGLGLGLGYPYYSSAYYSDPCVAWNDYTWVNICY